MPDHDTTIQQLKDLIADFQARRDWAKFHTPKNLAMGVAVETGELLEHFLWTTPEESLAVKNDPEQMDNIRDELADVFTYLLNLALVLDIDLADAFRHKIKKNAEKYPAHLYRGKYKLD